MFFIIITLFLIFVLSNVKFMKIRYFVSAVVLAAAALACIPWKAVLALLPQRAVRAAAYWLKPVAVTVLLLLSMALMVGQSYNPFLYFRF